MLRDVAFALLAAVGAFALAAPFPRPASAPDQPLAFSHRTHVTAGLECADCHAGSKAGEAATIPPLAKCLECHEEPAGENPEEPKVRDFATKSAEIPWRPWTRIQRSLVFFSHRRHAGAAGIPCEDCHGAMAERMLPPADSTAPISMDWCVECHRERGVSSDCLACHR